MRRVTSSFRPAQMFGLVGVAAAAVVTACSGGGTERALCERAAECANDPPGEDFVDVCTTRREGAVAALRANEEEECQELADAFVAFDACRAALDCDDYTEADLGGKCDDEKRDFDNAVEDAADDRYGGSAVGPGGLGPSLTAVPYECSSWE